MQNHYGSLQFTSAGNFTAGRLKGPAANRLRWEKGEEETGRREGFEVYILSAWLHFLEAHYTFIFDCAAMNFTLFR